MEDRFFPYLREHEKFQFPSPLDVPGEIVSVGGNLSPGMLLSAYSQGIFPWYNEDEPIYWWSLDPRFVLYPADIHVSKSMKKHIRKANFKLTLDCSFEQVIRNCSLTPRPGQDGTWISEEMIQAYLELHRLGYAHSVEYTRNGVLCGGLYGLALGRCFFGESMFAFTPNSSKTAFIALTDMLRDNEFSIIDCQQHTPHLGSLGAIDIPLSSFLDQLREALLQPTIKGNWSEIFPDFPNSTYWRKRCT